MQCEFCTWPFNRGEYIVRVYTYWREDHLGGEAYNDGMKPVGWAHVGCEPL